MQRPNWQSKNKLHLSFHAKTTDQWEGCIFKSILSCLLHAKWQHLNSLIQFPSMQSLKRTFFAFFQVLFLLVRFFQLPDSNPGRLVAKRERYRCAMRSPLKRTIEFGKSTLNNSSPPFSWKRWAEKVASHPVRQSLPSLSSHTVQLGPLHPGSQLRQDQSSSVLIDGPSLGHYLIQRDWRRKRVPITCS